MFRVSLFTALLLLSSTAGCRRSDTESTSQEPPAPEPTQRQELTPAEIQRLQALAYIGYADVDEDKQRDGVVVYDPERSCPGYNLYTMHQRCAAELIDEAGRVVRSWQHEPSQIWGSGELLPDGDFLVVAADRSDGPASEIADDSRCILRFNWQGELLWKRKLAAHHDVEVTPRGQLLTLTFQRRPVPELHPRVPVRDDVLTLLTPDGELLESLSLYDVFSAEPARFSFLQPFRMNRMGGAPWIDVFHANSVEWMRQEHLVGQHPIYDLSNVLICFRHQDCVAVVNWEKNELVWVWGRQELSAPHDAHVLASGNILVFDNGLRHKRSRIVEMDPRTGEIVWSYQAAEPSDFFTVSKGSNQRLPNGNTLITNSDRGQVFEVTPEGEIVWEFLCPHKNDAGQRATIVRTKRYERAYVELIQARFAPGEAPAEPRP